MIENHETDYKTAAWMNYSIEELGQWVSLLNKRAQHRDNPEKARKDLYDAKNYLRMIEEKLQATAKALNMDYSTL
jgi:hypothetical protein